ncbi:hypothetical protein DKX38_021675 [Salix brachista]|uniref:Uncharacterized protein n=1 Tax=Salix brachista TaxID=2182728 RepID=A0A5N5K8D4_9ROSI|nr:hypothetical protein DKX38_021675 [Salix brachista]
MPPSPAIPRSTSHPYLSCTSPSSSAAHLRPTDLRAPVTPPSRPNGKLGVVEFLELIIAKPEGIELPYPLAEKIVDNSKNN